jgi:hypothetical protein
VPGHKVRTAPRRATSHPKWKDEVVELLVQVGRLCPAVLGGFDGFGRLKAVFPGAFGLVCFRVGMRRFDAN